MEKKFVITIGRQFGSGGREVGIRVAEQLGIPCYDKKLISEAAKRSGLSSEMFEKRDEQGPNTLLYALSQGFGFGGGNGFSSENLFKIQSDTILEVAARESCVIVGRCADYVLREHPNCIDVFVHAPLEDRIAHVMARKDIGAKEAAEFIAKIDKSRAAYYDFYTDKQWGLAASYDLSVNSSQLGMQRTAQYICNFVKATLEEK